MGESIPLDKMARIVELTQVGKFKSEISELLGISKSTVYKYQQRFNLL